MALTAVDKIKEIQERAEAEIKALRQQALSEIVKGLAAAKEEVRSLELQYSQLTGKPLPSDSDLSTPQDGEKRRKRLSDDEKTVLAETLKGVLAAHPRGVSMKEQYLQTGQKAPVIKEALGRIAAMTTGAAASTRYYLN